MDGKSGRKKGGAAQTRAGSGGFIVLEVCFIDFQLTQRIVMIIRPGPLFRSPAQGVTAFREGKVVPIRSAQIVNHILECVPEETQERPYL